LPDCLAGFDVRPIMELGWPLGVLVLPCNKCSWTKNRLGFDEISFGSFGCFVEPSDFGQ